MPAAPTSRLPLALGAVLFVGATVGVSWWRWWTFQYGTFDLAFYVQALWLALHGEWNVSLLNVPLLGNHAEPIVFLMVPLFALWPHAMLPVVVQALALASMPFTARRIALRLGHTPRDATLLALTTLLLPATAFVALHEFHAESLSAPLLLLMIEARLGRRMGLFWLWFVGALACKENIALLLVGYCAVHFLMELRQNRRWQLRWNIVPAVVAFTWLIVYARVLSPALNAGNVDYAELYSHLGTSGSDIVRNFFVAPQRALSAFWHALTSGNLVWGMLLPLLCLPLFRPAWLLIAAPVLMQHLLSLRPVEWSIELHYAAPLIPLFWMAAAEVSVRLSRPAVVAVLLPAACAVGQFWIGPGRQLESVQQVRWHLWQREWKARMIADIAANHELSVMASQPYLPHLAQRRDLHSLHHTLKGLKTLSRQVYVPPAVVDAVVIDFADATTFSPAAGYYHPQMRLADGRIIPPSEQLLRAYLAPASWQQTAQNELTVLRRADSPAAKASESEGTVIAPGVTLVEFTLTAATPSTPAFCRARWRITDERRDFPWLLLAFSDGKLLRTILLGSCALGTSPGEMEEAWALQVPPDSPETDYACFAIFYDHTQAAWARQLPPRDQTFTFRTIPLGNRRLGPTRASQ